MASKFATVPAVSIGGSSISVGVDFLEEDTGYWAMWDYNQKSLRFVNALTTGTTSVVGYPQYPLIYQKSDESSVNTYGNFEFVIIDKNIKDLETASLRADAELLRFAIPAKTARFSTIEYGLVVGQTINIQSAIRGYDDNYKIQSIRTSMRTPHLDDLVHSVECVTADDLGINDILNKLLVKNPSDQIDVSADEVVSRIRQFKDTFGIYDTAPTHSEDTGPYYYGTDYWGFSTWS